MITKIEEQYILTRLQQLLALYHGRKTGIILWTYR